MHILYVSQYFPPEVGAGSFRAYELAKRWVQLGHRVSVLTGYPSPSYLPYLSLNGYDNDDGIDVFRCSSWRLKDRSIFDRVFAYSSLSITTLIKGMCITRPDVVVASSPPLTTGITGSFLSKIRRAAFVFDVRDLWPESLVDLSSVRQGSLLERLMGAIVGCIYRDADAVVVTSDATRDSLLERGKTSAETTFKVTNGVDTDATARDHESVKIRESLGISNKFIVSFIGNMGLAQDFNIIIQSIKQLSYLSDQIHFLFVGDGPVKQRVMEKTTREAFTNVTFLSRKPKEVADDFICASDVCLVTMRNARVNELIIPFRLLKFMFFARPILISAQGQSANLVKESRSGIVVKQSDPRSLSSAILSLLSSSGMRKTMGQCGHRYIVENYSVGSLAQDYLSILEKTVAMKTKGR